MASGWTVHLRGPGGGEAQLEHLGTGADEWFGDGPGGTAVGTLAAVIGETMGPHADPEWQAVAAATVWRECLAEQYRVGLVLRRGAGAMFHATRTANRESIARDGLDWRRMQTRGVAGSTEPESRGIFLCSSLGDAHWFAGMVHGETADIWRVRVDGLWLVSDPNSSGGLDDHWVIATEPIPPASLHLVERDLFSTGRRD